MAVPPRQRANTIVNAYLTLNACFSLSKKNSDDSKEKVFPQNPAVSFKEACAALSMKEMRWDILGKVTERMVRYQADLYIRSANVNPFIYPVKWKAIFTGGTDLGMLSSFGMHRVSMGCTPRVNTRVGFGYSLRPKDA